MLAVRLHPLPADPPDGHPAPTRDPDLARRPLPLRPPVTAHRRVTGPIVPATFRRNRCSARHPGLHADRQCMVYTTRSPAAAAAATPSSTSCAAWAWCRRTPAQPPHHLRQGRTIPADHEEVAGRPTRPAGPPSTAAGPARHLRRLYNHHRPHRSLPHRATPATVYTARPKATPTGSRDADTHDRVRRDRVDNTGMVTLRLPRPPAPHRHRPNPRPNPRHPARPRPRHPRRQRRHRRTPPRAHPRPHPRLPAHRPTPRTHPLKQTSRTHEMWVRPSAMS